MSRSSGKRKRVVLDIYQKLKIIERASNGESVVKLAAEAGIGITTVRGIIKQKDELLDYASKSDSLTSLQKRKSMKGSSVSDVDNALYQWYQQKIQEGELVSASMMCKQAQVFHQQLGINGTFSASSGWLKRFKERHGIQELNMVGGKCSGDLRAASEFKKGFQQLIDRYSLTPHQIYNADETGLHWRSLPSKTLAIQSYKSDHGYEVSKDKIIIICCANASGEHKMKLACVGQEENPYSIKGIKSTKVNSVPVDYFKTKSALMESDIFKCWFHSRFIPEVSNYLKSKGLPQKAILFIDNAPLHPSDSELKSADGLIFATFLPQSITSMVQPMEQGVILAVKRYYRRELLELLVKEGSNLTDFEKKLGMKEALQLLDNAWKYVTKRTISWSWRHLYDDCDDLIDGFEGFEDLDVDDPESVQFTETIRSIIAGCDQFSEVRTENINEWLSHDDQLIGYQTLVDDVNVSTTTPASTSSVCADESKSDEEDVINEKWVSLPAALKATETLLHYVVQEDDCSMSDIMCIRKIRADIKRKILEING